MRDNLPDNWQTQSNDIFKISTDMNNHESTRILGSAYEFSFDGKIDLVAMKALHTRMII
jgi:hypothetical protein